MDGREDQVVLVLQRHARPAARGLRRVEHQLGQEGLGRGIAGGDLLDLHQVGAARLGVLVQAVQMRLVPAPGQSQSGRPVRLGCHRSGEIRPAGGGTGGRLRGGLAGRSARHPACPRRGAQGRGLGCHGGGSGSAAGARHRRGVLDPCRRHRSVGRPRRGGLLPQLSAFAPDKSHCIDILRISSCFLCHALRGRARLRPKPCNLRPPMKHRWRPPGQFGGAPCQRHGASRWTDLLRTRLAEMIDPRHDLAKLAGLIDWEVFEREWSRSSRRRPAVRPRRRGWLLGCCTSSMLQPPPVMSPKAPGQRRLARGLDGEPASAHRLAGADPGGVLPGASSGAARQACPQGRLGPHPAPGPGGPGGGRLQAVAHLPPGRGGRADRPGDQRNRGRHHLGGSGDRGQGADRGRPLHHQPRHLRRAAAPARPQGAGRQGAAARDLRRGLPRADGFRRQPGGGRSDVRIGHFPDRVRRDRCRARPGPVAPLRLRGPRQLRCRGLGQAARRNGPRRGS